MTSLSYPLCNDCPGSLTLRYFGGTKLRITITQHTIYNIRYVYNNV